LYVYDLAGRKREEPPMAVGRATVDRVAGARASRTLERALGQDWRLAYALLVPVLLEIVGLIDLL
jgi:hypothetical protein